MDIVVVVLLFINAFLLVAIIGSLALIRQLLEKYFKESDSRNNLILLIDKLIDERGKK